MAKKKTAQEDCMLCGQSPCVCDDGHRRRSHALRDRIAEHEKEVETDGEDS